MPVISTDDSSRRLRNIWLGPKGWRLPDARFEAWGMFIALVIVFGTGAALLLPTLRLDVTGVLLSVIPALLITRAVMRHADHDMPLRYWWRTMRAEVATPRPAQTERTEHVVTVSPTIFKGKP